MASAIMALADPSDAAVGTFGGRKTALGYQRGAWVSMATSAPSSGAVRAGAAELLALALTRRARVVTRTYGALSAMFVVSWTPISGSAGYPWLTG